MSNPFRHRVNYCLQQAQQRLAETGLPEQETALFFLYRAYALYLREMAHELALPDDDWVSARSLADALQAREAGAETVAECQRLESDGFLAALQQAWQVLLFPAVTVAGKAEQQPDVLGSDRPAVSAAALPKLADIHQALAALIERQRQMAAEY